MWYHITQLFLWGRHYSKYFSGHIANPLYEESVEFPRFKDEVTEYISLLELPVMKYFKLGGVTEMYFLTVLGTRRSKSRCQKGHLRSRFWGRICSAAFS